MAFTLGGRNLERPDQEMESNPISGVKGVGLHKRAYGRIVPSRMNGLSQTVIKEPIGPVIAFVAWNFPVMNVVRKVGGALAAGCTITIKPSEETPGTAIAIGRAFTEAGLPPGVLNLSLIHI